MNATAYFIKDRALSLAYEADQFPAAAETVLAWFGRAVAWTKARGLNALAKELEAMCYGMNCSHEDRYSGECTFHGRGMFPCAVDEEEAGEDFAFSEAEPGDDEKENAA